MSALAEVTGRDAVQSKASELKSVLPAELQRTYMEVPVISPTGNGKAEEASIYACMSSAFVMWRWDVLP